MEFRSSMDLGMGHRILAAQRRFHPGAIKKKHKGASKTKLVFEAPFLYRNFIPFCPCQLFILGLNKIDPR